jgi:hypothetical protein
MVIPQDMQASKWDDCEKNNKRTIEAPHSTTTKPKNTQRTFRHTPQHTAHGKILMVTAKNNMALSANSVTALTTSMATPAAHTAATVRPVVLATTRTHTSKKFNVVKWQHSTRLVRTFP